MNRGVDRQDIFVSDADRRIFLEELGDAAELFGVEVHAYCLMTNHFHLVVRCLEGGLSTSVQRVTGRYADYFNRRLEREGSVFTGRFVSVPLEIEDDDGTDPDRSFLVAVRYVHRNPLDLVSLRALDAYAYSSYGTYVADRSGPAWLRQSLVRSLHGDDPDRIRRFTETWHASDRTPALGRDVEPYRPVDVIAVVAAAAGLSVDSLVEQRRGSAGAARAIAAHLCVDLRTASSAELAAVFGIATQQGARQLAARGKKLVSADPSAAGLSERALDRLHKTDAAA